MKTQTLKKSVQSGFTLIELIVVIVILGILAAVAIPKLTSTSGSARSGVQDATVGALKSAWAVAYAKAKVSPTTVQIAAEMLDPGCASSAAGVITCTGVTLLDGTGSASFTATGVSDNATAVANPSLLTVSTRGTAP